MRGVSSKGVESAVSLYCQIALAGNAKAVGVYCVARDYLKSPTTLIPDAQMLVSVLVNPFAAL